MKNRSKIDEKSRSKTACVLASIFHRFWWLLGGKLGMKTEPRCLQNRSRLRKDAFRRTSVLRKFKKSNFRFPEQKKLQRGSGMQLRLAAGNTPYQRRRNSSRRKTSRTLQKLSKRPFDQPGTLWAPSGAVRIFSAAKPRSRHHASSK